MSKADLHTALVAGLSATAGALIASLVGGYFTLRAAEVSSNATIAAAAANSRAQNSIRISETNKEKAVPFYSALSAFARAAVVGSKDKQAFEAAWVELDRSAAALDPYLDYPQSSRLAVIMGGYRSMLFDSNNYTDSEHEKVVKARSDFDVEFHATNERLEFSAQSEPEDQKRLYQIKQEVYEESLYPFRQQGRNQTPN